MSRSARFAFVSLITLLTAPAVAPSARADGVLTLDLPPSPAAIEMRDAQREQAHIAAQEAARAATTQLVSAHAPVRHDQTRRQVSYASRGGQSERVVGRLGNLQRTTSIFRIASTESPLLIRASAGTYVAIQAERGDWYGVLMADGSIGWLHRSAVQILNYQVVANGPMPGQSAPSLPSGSDDGDIYPRTASPFFTGDPQMLLAEAYKYMGVRYVWGGNTANGIDCSGFIKNVFGACGYPLPRLGSDQMAYGVPVPPDQLQPGDRLYFGRRTERLGVTHTGLYIGNGYFIHSSSGHHGVAISRLTEYARIYVCARR